MRLAIQKAREGVGLGQSPYGACLVKEGEVVSCAHNTVRASLDPTAHAEVQALREGCAKLGNLDLTGCEIYCTCEPCPMCFFACHNAGVTTIVYGVSLRDVTRGGRFVPSSQTMKEVSESPIQTIPGYLREEALQLYRK